MDRKYWMKSPWAEIRSTGEIGCPLNQKIVIFLLTDINIAALIQM